MYGGDEVSAIVIDLGSHTCKAGYAGEDAPKAVFPSVVSPFKDGAVVDWDIVDNIWDHALRLAELLFENYKVPALFVAKNAVLTSFASGRATSLVVDSGGGSTTVAPVHDGYVLQKGVVTSPIGGEFLTECMMKSLESKGITLKPRYSFKRKETRPGDFQTIDLDFPNTTESYRLYCQRLIASDIKECVCRAPDTPFDESAYANIPMTPYELPDGQLIEIGADRFKIPDVLFNPSLVQTIPGMETFLDSTSLSGLPQMVIDSINKCDVDIRRELFSSILLSGGTASMQQLKERLEKDLTEEAPQAARVKVLASGNATERRFSVWIGGSILASLGSFQQMWFSKGEYEEHGASYIQRKCP
ncbi:hypothetical protein HPP92_025625 [Vanilla planifolia]|uniref:Actin-related protein 4 n=1 Tax=Vanilla planifolia TaxID=51239 RepID=A0A835PLC6_VANPL|nr:hypothetical protein HPP92_025625 [Vanilla planifolia]